MAKVKVFVHATAADADADADADGRAMTLAPRTYLSRLAKKQRDNTKMQPKTSITQRLWTDLGRSVGVTIATQLVWLNRLTGSQTSH